MRTVIQRVSESSVRVDDKIVGAIDKGLMILLGIEQEDNTDDIEWLVAKITKLRIFSDDDEKMNLNINDVGGAFLVISQFTLHASTKKGNRPSFIKAARPEIAIPLYEKFIEELRSRTGLIVESGEFGGDMKVSLINDGPVTIIIDSKTRE